VTGSKWNAEYPAGLWVASTQSVEKEPRPSFTGGTRRGCRSRTCTSAAGDRAAAISTEKILPPFTSTRASACAIAGNGVHRRSHGRDGSRVPSSLLIPPFFPSTNAKRDAWEGWCPTGHGGSQMEEKYGHIRTWDIQNRGFNLGHFKVKLSIRTLQNHKNVNIYC
jgi:hypothetical protein